MQRYISPVTVSFIYILEPVLGAFMAAYYLHEMLPLAGYVGGLLVVLGALIHTCGTALSARTDADEEIYIEELDGDIDAIWYARPREPAQSGVYAAPYALARRGEKLLLQRRRRQRVLRLGC
jgi:hypothetical protein